MDIEVVSAELVQNGDERMWMLGTRVDRGDGSPVEMRAHVMPEDTLEWRAAELGIDPADTDTLLRIVLVEPYLTDDTADPNRALHTAETTVDARTHHLQRINARLGATGRIRGRRGAGQVRAAGPRAKVLLHSGTEDPLAVIKRESPIDPDFVAVKREYVARVRDEVRTRRGQVAAAGTQAARAVAPGFIGPQLRPRRGSADELRERLLGDHGGGRDPGR